MNRNLTNFAWVNVNHLSNLSPAEIGTAHLYIRYKLFYNYDLIEILRCRTAKGINGVIYARFSLANFSAQIENLL